MYKQVDYVNKILDSIQSADKEDKEECDKIKSLLYEDLDLNAFNHRNHEPNRPNTKRTTSKSNTKRSIRM